MREKSKDFHGFTDKSTVNYIKEVKKMEILDGNSQIELAVRAKLGDEKAKESLVKSNLRFVMSIAREYQNNSCGLTLNDLINEGNIGLIRSIDKFDETRGVKFISYAVWWIRQSIIQSIYENSNTIKLPINKINDINKINKAKDSLFSKLRRDPTAEEIYRYLCEKNKDNELSISDIIMISESNLGCISLDAPIQSSSDDNMFLHDVISDDSSDFDGEINVNMVKDMLYEAIGESLSSREADILKMYFGLDGIQMSLKEISKIVGITNERVRQIKDNAIRKLRSFKHKDLRKLINTEF